MKVVSVSCVGLYGVLTIADSRNLYVTVVQVEGKDDVTGMVQVLICESTQLGEEGANMWPDGARRLLTPQELSPAALMADPVKAAKLRDVAVAEFRRATEPN